MVKTRLALFASGTGSNALNIIDYFSGHVSIEVTFVLTNRNDAPIIESAKKKGIETLAFSNEQVSSGNFLVEVCSQHKIDFVILAGYLRLIPNNFIEHYPEKIINIHPALLPSYGGHGMYGDRVHTAVLEAKEEISGISIHYVDQHFDRGRMIAQLYCPVSPNCTLEQLKQKVQHLEHAYYPIVIEKTILLNCHV